MRVSSHNAQKPSVSLLRQFDWLEGDLGISRRVVKANVPATQFEITEAGDKAVKFQTSRLANFKTLL